MLSISFTLIGSLIGSVLPNGLAWVSFVFLVVGVLSFIGLFWLLGYGVSILVFIGLALLYAFDYSNITRLAVGTPSYVTYLIIFIPIGDIVGGILSFLTSEHEVDREHGTREDRHGVDRYY